MESDEIKEAVTAFLEDDTQNRFDVKEVVTNLVKDDVIKSVLEKTSQGDANDNDNTSIENASSVQPECQVGNSHPKYKFQNFIPLTGDYENYKYQEGKEHYLKGCKWSPDGTCLLTCCVDNKLRLYDVPTDLIPAKSWKSTSQLPKLNISLKVQEGSLVYDYCWFPLMNSWDPISCCFLSTPNEEPVHLWDAFTGDLRASYRSYNYADDLISAFSLSFNPSGERIYCGFRDSIKIFDTAIPGRTSRRVNIKADTGQIGIVSCIAFNPATPSVYAVGTYTKEIGLYSEENGSGVCLFKGHSGGITHLLFSPDGNRLYSGSRKDSEIVCWDVRNPGTVLFSLLRTVSTNQRIYFDLTPDGSMLMTGNTDGSVRFWNMDDPIPNPETPLEEQISFKAHKDCCNGVSINPICPVLATTSGQRHFPDVVSESEDIDNFENIADDEEISSGQTRRKDSDLFFNVGDLKSKVEDCIKLWWVGDTEPIKNDVL